MMKRLGILVLGLAGFVSAALPSDMAFQLTQIGWTVERAVMSQVAARRNANPKLYPLDLSQDRLAGGCWAPTPGHARFLGPMLEENANGRCAIPFFRSAPRFGEMAA